ncbi:Metal-dependent phosphohydrolase [Kitasatospora sp. MMS16-BH015]|uniref:HD-GYP domain-containing protein n=1 Tax=Kitasatospora sp. MMS16-BH015 TaxID=2018025 RepID=UPI000CA1A7B7|nr:HD-GYP domain-containing protein [Kitasatospora sp. MMS16-BH015]AUG79601.1 Metal-dependent phosphohydrolase [Kitasatospora sp. MMS16-BH015]
MAEIAGEGTALPKAAVRYVEVVLLAAVVCLLSPLLWPGSAGAVDWPRVGLLAFLHSCWDALAQGRPTPCFRLARRLARRPVAGTAVPGPAAAFFPVLFAGVLMLPPAAAALVALPTALSVADGRPWRRLRGCWNAAQLALAACTAAVVFRLLDGPRLLLGSRFPGAVLPVLAAVAVFCLVNTGLVAGMRSLAEPGCGGGGRRPGRLLSALVHGAGGLMVAVLWQGPYGAFAAVLALLPLSISAWVFAEGHRERTAHQAAVQALVQAVEIKDAYTRGHSERVGRAAVLIARQLGMAEERLRTLHFAGTLHDVGKLGVATELLRRNGPLTEAERRAVEVHPVFGHELVREITFLGEARAGILHHHERMDGRGYPAGLVGAGIPEFARIISVADAFDSMTSTRSYRRGRPVPEAVAELERCAGSQFDPVMVRALVAAVAEHGWQPALPPPDEQAVPDIPLGVPEPARRRVATGGSGAA